MWKVFVAGAAVVTALFISCGRSDSEQKTLVSGNFIKRTYLQPVVTYSTAETEDSAIGSLCWYALTERFRWSPLEPTEVPQAFQEAVQTASGRVSLLTQRAVTLEEMNSQFQTIPLSNGAQDGVIAFLDSISKVSRSISGAAHFLDESGLGDSLVQIVGVGAAFYPEAAPLIPIVQGIVNELPKIAEFGEQMGSSDLGRSELEMTEEGKASLQAKLIDQVNREVQSPDVLHTISGSEMRNIKLAIESSEQTGVACPETW